VAQRKRPEELPWPDLVRACGENLKDRSLWDQFSKSFEKPLFAFLLRAVRQKERQQEDTRALVHDLAQEVYIRLFENNGQLLRSFRGQSEFSVLAFLARVSMNVSGDRYRRDRAQRRSAEIISIEDARDRDVAQVNLDAQTRWSDVERLIHADPDSSNRARNVLICKLHYLDRLSAEEIAQYPGFGLTANGVEAVIRRTREYLQRRAHEL
jgi:RNA polymerase sigma factor (sigma-70 family)